MELSVVYPSPGFRESYIKELKEKYANEHINLPNGVLSNCRTWDYEQIIKYGHFKASDAVLECGALNTMFCGYMSDRVLSYYATDSYYWSERAFADGIQTPREWEELCDRVSSGRIKAEKADLTELPYENESFDKVLSISTIEHVPNHTQAIREIWRVLKPGGRFLLTSEYHPKIGKEYDESDGSFMRIYDQQTVRVLQNGFDVEVMLNSQTEEQIERMQHRFKFTTLFMSMTKI